MSEISVIMGVYNVPEQDLLRSVGSVLNQTYADLELIVCDDGSTDDTWKRLKGLAADDPRIRLLRNEKNRGLAGALNRCLASARGKLIARQDADDVSEPDRLEKQERFLETHSGVGFVGSWVTLFDEKGEWGLRRFPESPEPKDFLFFMPFVHGALLFRRECLDAAGGYRTDRTTYRSEDYDLLMRMYACGIRGANIPECLYHFREDTGASRRRKYAYRLNEAIVRYRGFCRLGLLPRGIPYVIKPLAVGLIPARLLRRMKFAAGKYEFLRDNGPDRK